jgi:hypothetical protein
VAGETAIRARRNRWLFLGLVAVAVLPLVVAYVLYEGTRGGEPWATTNHGELLEAGRSLDRLGVTDLAGAPLLLDERAWRLLVVSDGTCDDACAEALHQLRQLHLLLNKDAARLRRTLVFLGPVPAERVAAIEADDPELGLARGHAGPLRPGVFLADPLGNLVLYYRFEQAGRPILDDLKRLMRVSQIG